MVETYKNKFNKRHGFPKDKSHSIANIAKLSKISLSSAKKIVEKGKGAFFSNPQSVRKQVKSPTQWGIARLYSAVMGGAAAKVDKKELAEGRKAFKGK
jgi:hypothetical protein